MTLRTAELLLGGKRYSRAVLTELSAAVRDRAKQNVAPGQGPGPHPHKPGWTHIDTGLLMSSINSVVSHDTGNEVIAVVYSDLNYPRPYNVYLELGWISAAGSRFVYPYLWPASEVAQQQFGNVAKRLYYVLAGKLGL